MTPEEQQKFLEAKEKQIEQEAIASLSPDEKAQLAAVSDPELKQKMLDDIKKEALALKMVEAELTP